MEESNNKNIGCIILTVLFVFVSVGIDITTTSHKEFSSLGKGVLFFAAFALGGWIFDSICKSSESLSKNNGWGFKSCLLLIACIGIPLFFAAAIVNTDDFGYDLGVIISIIITVAIGVFLYITFSND